MRAEEAASADPTRTPVLDFPYAWLVRVPLAALLLMLLDLAVRAVGGDGGEVTVWLSKVSSSLLVGVWLCQWFVVPAAIYGCLYRPAWRSWRHGLAVLSGAAYWVVVGRMVADSLVR